MHRRLPVALAVALMLTGCSSADDSTTAEETLTLYSGRTLELVEPLIEQFEADTGIKVQVRDGDSTSIAGQILEEGDKTAADVFLSQDAGALGVLSDAGLLAPLDDDVTALVDPSYTSQDGSWVGLTGRARVIAYDSETLSADEVPTNVLELVDEKWRGQVGIAPTNASFQSFVTALRVSEGEDVAREWLEGLIANNAQIYDKNGPILEAVNGGALKLGLINHYYWARYEGDPLTQRAQIAFGDPGSVSALVNVSGVAILKGSQDSEAAKKFVEFLVSEKAQTYFLEETAEYPLALDGATPAGVPPLGDLGGPDIDLSDLASLEQTVAMLTEVGLL